jgi:glycosyltransferase involved in cell wall biosynthesis
MVSLRVSVIICTYNPRRAYLQRVLEALAAQTLPKDQWELILVDNASTTPLASEFELNWHPHGIQVREEKQGLTAARLCGIAQASADCLVFVDDDNVLEQDYLKHTVEILQQQPSLGAIGGKSLPEFEIPPTPWVQDFSACLALRDLGNQVQIAQPVLPVTQYPAFAPIGAGLVIRRPAAEVYAQKVIYDQSRLALGRTGQQLTSGEDNDIVLTLLEAGWGVGYFPQLHLTHLISANRLTTEYLARLNYASSRSWVQVLDVHQIRPWQKIAPWSVLPRQLKAFWSYQPWKSPVHYIRWQGACGLYEGLSTLLD